MRPADQRSKFLFVAWREAACGRRVSVPTEYGLCLDWEDRHHGRRVTVLTKDGRAPSLSYAAQADVHVVSVGRIFDISISAAQAILESYLANGVKAICGLEGDFSAVLFDSRRFEILAVRDSFGVKPLFHGSTEEALVLGTSPRDVALLLSDSPKANDDFIGAALGCGHVELGATVWGGVYRVPPSHAITWRARGAPSMIRTWRPNIEVRPDLRFEEAAEEVRAALTLSIRRHLQGEGLSFLLSGGLDSTLVAAAAMATDSLREARCVSVTAAFPGFPFDESAEVARNAEKLRLDPSFVDIGRRDLVTGWKTFARITEEPPDQDTVPTMVFCAEELSKSGVRSVLTGMAADFIFDDYGRAVEDRIAGGQALETVVSFFTHQELPTWWIVRRLRSGLRNALRHRCAVAPRYPIAFHAQPRRLRNLWFDDEQQSDLWPLVRFGAQRRLWSLSMLIASGWYERLASLYGSFGIEMRNPFLDRELMSAVLSMEPGLVSHGLRRKSLLQTAARRWTQGLEINPRGKPAYGAPLTATAWKRYLDSETNLETESGRNGAPVTFPRLRTEPALAIRQLLRHEIPHDVKLNDETLWNLIALSIWRKEKESNDEQTQTIRGARLEAA